MVELLPSSAQSSSGIGGILEHGMQRYQTYLNASILNDKKVAGRIQILSILLFHAFIRLASILLSWKDVVNTGEEVVP